MERDGIPSPKLVAAWMEFDVLADASQVPVWAAHWLVDGWDAPGLPGLAGLDGRDPFEVRRRTVDALDELGIGVRDRGEAAELVLRYEAERCLSGRIDERALAAAVSDFFVRTGYADEILDQPLGGLYGLDDEWAGGWGRTDGQLRVAVRDACRTQIAAIEGRT